MTGLPLHRTCLNNKCLKDFATNRGLEIFVETGTYCGDMIEAMRKSFAQLYSIELSHELYLQAAERFEPYDHIEIIQGDSGERLGDLMKKINRPSLFWLDGHYSAESTARGAKDTPIYEELDHIINSQDFKHIIVIDDARCFGANPGYPNIEELKDYVTSKNANIQFKIKFDSIQLAPI